jgi:hypothetical protein
MSKADEMIGRLVAFVDGDESYELMIATSMGQEATVAQPIETQLYVTDGAAFMSRLGVPRDSWAPRPAMVPQFNVQVSATLAGSLENRLKTLLVNGEAIPFVHKSDGFFSVGLGQPNLASISITLGGAPVSLSELGWANVEIQDKSGSTAYHIPQGSLLRYHRTMAPSGHVSKISTLDVFPHVLANFGIKAPAYANAPATL